MQSIAQLTDDLAQGRITARALIEDSLARIADPDGEGGRAFIRVHAEQARAMADASDLLRRAGRVRSPYDGIPIGLKDLCDVAGEPTPAGSVVLADAPAATTTAPAVARLIATGFIPVGRTNMTEFAFSGLGLNPHYGTPRAPWDRATGRVPGGSSSGTAVAVADGMVAGGVGTDTGGSCRVPAAMCGVVGYKPTARRVPIEGILPLATSLDSVGPLARSVACCAALDAVMAGTPLPPPAMALAGLRLAVPTTRMLDDMDEVVAAAFQRALGALSAAGARVTECAFPVIEAIRAAQPPGGLAGVEAFAWHRTLIGATGDRYDPHIRARILGGAATLAADYIAAINTRARLIRQGNAETAGFDALVMPTSPIVPPRIAEVAEDPGFTRINMQILRNTSPFNYLDRCAISLPCHAPGEPPVGLMLVGPAMGDARLFQIAAAVEAIMPGAASP